MGRFSSRLKTVLILFSLWPAVIIQAQSTEPLTLEKAYQLAEKNYPSLKQRDLIRRSADIKIENLGKGFLPQVNIVGQASYQSEVSQIGVTIPGFTFEPLAKDQYKIVADANLLLYDGGSIKEQKALEEIDVAVQQQQITVELYQLKERINQIFLGVLYLDEQQKQMSIITKDLQTGIDKVGAMVENGVAYRSDLNVLKAELLKTEQRGIEIKASRKGLLDMLAIFLNQPVPEETQLEKPSLDVFVPVLEIQRPEIQLFNERTRLAGQQTNLIHARNLPSARIFLQEGYGRPGLNFLKNGFTTFYIAGVRINWALDALYTSKKDKELVQVNQKVIEVQKETFLLNTNTQLKQEQSSIEKLQQLISSDASIIDLRRQVKESARAQMENGVITANDYLREVNAEDLARQSLITHQIQLLQAQINYKTIAGKQ